MTYTDIHRPTEDELDTGDLSLVLTLRMKSYRKVCFTKVMKVTLIDIRCIPDARCIKDAFSIIQKAF